MQFTHLHVHTHYTLLTALGKPEELLARAKEMGQTALAITDTSALYGAVEFYMKAKDYGIKAIIGAEIFLCKDLTSKNNTAEDRRRNTLVLLVKNETGYKNLLKIISIAQLDGFYYKARADKKLLRQYSEGLIALSGSLQGEVPAEFIYGDYERAKRAALEYQEIFGPGNFYLEVQPHFDNEAQATANQGLIALSRETGIPLVAANDVHYVRREDASVQDTLLCIRDNKRVDDHERFSMMSLDLSLRSTEDMVEAFKDFPDAIENTQKIAEACNFSFTFGVNHLPSYPLPEGVTADTYLRNLCEEGLRKRFPEQVINEEQRTRLNYELDVIEKTGFASYFLIVQDFVNWAKNNGVVVGPGRGSAAGSFVAYLTGITNLDPIKYDLLFERFLNPERISMPDVDMDFADDHREDVLNYVRERYGADHVAQIITFGTMAARAAIRDVGRALGIPLPLCDQTAKMIPMFTSIKKALEEVPEFKAHYDSNAEVRRLVDNAQKIEGLSRHTSMHACGVVITKDPVTEYTPLQRVSGSREGVVTQYASSTKANAVEKIGLLKMDFLGLKNLTIIQNTIRIIRALGKLDAFTTTLGLDPEKASVSDIMDKLPLDDVAAFKVLQDAHTTGVFQLESTGMKRYLKQLKPTVFEDIIAMVALYRPGPMDYIPDFIGGKHGTKQVEYLHPKLEPILKNTYGVAVYQEQLMQIARDLAGFSLGEADVLRKAVGKKIKELVAEQRVKFVSGCVNNGIKKDVAEHVFDFIEPFAGYGFNRSHAACYALIGYQTAYLKAHYPAEFMAALLTSDQNDTDRIAIEVREAREIGIEVLQPDVNESFESFAVIRGDDGIERIRFGLQAIKNVGSVCAEEIVKERKRGGKFKSLEDFVERVQTKDLNKKSLEALAKVGALDQLGEREQILESIDAIVRHSKQASTIVASHTQSLFGSMPLSKPTIHLIQAAPAPKQQKLSWEKELLGLYITDHPASEYRHYFAKTTVPLNDLEKRENESRIRIGGLVTAVRRVMTKNGNPMFFIGLEDLTGRTEVLVFGKTAEQTEGFWKEDDIVILDVRISNKDGQLRCIAESAERISLDTLKQFERVRVTHEKTETEKKMAQEKLASVRKLAITMDSTADSHRIEHLSAFLKQAPKGDTKVIVKLHGSTIETPFCIDPSKDILAALSALEGVESVL
jgi:DNA polymerase-3 subunit alpha